MNCQLFVYNTIIHDDDAWCEYECGTTQFFAWPVKNDWCSFFFKY